MSRRQTLTNDILFGSTAPAAAEDQREGRDQREAPVSASPGGAAQGVAPSSSPTGPGSAAAMLLAERPGLTQGAVEDEPAAREDTLSHDVVESADSRVGAAVDRPARRRPAEAGERRPSGRERHDEKITVYLSADELDGIDLAQLDLRRRFGIRVDRGRIVREAVAVLLADLDARGEGSTVVKRLAGRR